MCAATPPRRFDRFIVIVCDSLGCGDAPDAATFGDEGANTLARVIEREHPAIPNLARLGLDRIPGVPSLDYARGGSAAESGAAGTSALGAEAAGGASGVASAAWGRLTERSGAKDTMSGHWELMCVVSSAPFPVYPDGFPPHVMRRFEQAIGRGTLGNRPASGTAIIEELGAEHLRSRKPIVYTSADSVFQIAAHEDVVPVEELYAMCETARRQLDGEHRVARVIARPFVGDAASGFRRTGGRRDFALEPPEPTALDLLVEAGFRTYAVGKIHDIFAGRGVSEHVKTANNDEGMDRTLAAVEGGDFELIFTNLVDFDTDFGHRRDVAGYAAALAAFDAGLPRLLRALGASDCLMITADHGNDPGWKGSDHTRERVPLLVPAARAVDLGTRRSFADVGATLLDNFGLRAPRGTSFVDAL